MALHQSWQAPRSPWLWILLARSLKTEAASGVWYEGLAGIHVYAPGDAAIQESVNAVYEVMRDAPFNYDRHALLFTRGDYGSLRIPVGFHTSVHGVGHLPTDVVIDSFYSEDDARGRATGNFWRSVEGLTTSTSDRVTYAASQACPLRRIVIGGDLWLSGEGAPHWSSGGFAADVTVHGILQTGTQQQFFFRNSAFGGVSYSDMGWNFVFAGVHGAPWQSNTSKRYEVTSVPAVPTIAGKPYLVEENGDWWIAVPSWQGNSAGPSHEAEAELVPMSAIYVARPGEDAAAINAGIRGKRALLLTPAVYVLSEAIIIEEPGFVVLGLGLPMLISTGGLPALEITAINVRVAGLLFEAGAAVGAEPTEALLLWRGNAGLASDIFARIGAFSGSPAGRCALTRVDVMMQVNAAGVVLDNTWLWHADHDDCNRTSDSCHSGRGLVVQGDLTTTYGLAVEHTMDDQVYWNGENGLVLFYQAELPYHDVNYGEGGRSGYRVDYRISRHTALGLGVYIVGKAVSVDSAFRVPPNASITNALAWTNGGKISQFRHGMLCTSDGTSDCIVGDQCTGWYCYLSSLRTPPSFLQPEATVIAVTV